MVFGIMLEGLIGNRLLVLIFKLKTRLFLFFTSSVLSIMHLFFLPANSFLFLICVFLIFIEQLKSQREKEENMVEFIDVSNGK